MFVPQAALQDPARALPQARRGAGHAAQPPRAALTLALALARAEAWGAIMDSVCGPKGAKRGAKAR